MLVDVYWNVHKHVYSVRSRETRKVVAHCTNLVLTDVTFKVSEKGRQRVLKERQKNVHAFISGTLVDELPPVTPAQAYYNPYKVECFVDRETWEPLHGADVVVLSRDEEDTERAFIHYAGGK